MPGVPEAPKALAVIRRAQGVVIEEHPAAGLPDHVEQLVDTLLDQAPSELPFEIGGRPVTVSAVT